MAKSLSERIAQRVSAKQPSRTGKNRASFLAVRDDVRKALDDGWPVKVIWDTLRDEGKIEFGYTWSCKARAASALCTAL